MWCPDGPSCLTGFSTLAEGVVENAEIIEKQDFDFSVGWLTFEISDFIIIEGHRDPKYNGIYDRREDWDA